MKRMVLALALMLGMVGAAQAKPYLVMEGNRVVASSAANCFNRKHKDEGKGYDTRPAAKQEAPAPRVGIVSTLVVLAMGAGGVLIGCAAAGVSNFNKELSGK